MNYETTIAAVRAISEGHAPARRLRTIPVQTLILKPAPPEAPIIAVEEQTCGAGCKLGELTLSEAMLLFRQSKRGEFTSSQAVQFLTAAGWEGGGSALANVSGKLRALNRNGLVQEVRRDGVVVIWKFTENN